MEVGTLFDTSSFTPLFRYSVNTVTQGLETKSYTVLQYIPWNMHTVFALLCFVVVTHWLILPYPSGLLHWHCGNLTIAPVSAKQPWWIWINTSCEFIMNDCISTTKQSTTKPCAYFLGYTVAWWLLDCQWGMKHGLPLAGVAGCVIRWYKYRRVDTWSPLDSG